MAEEERHEREIGQLRQLLFLSLVVNVALSGAVIVAIVLK